MQEKIRRKDKVEIDMAVVEELKRHQKEVNHYLKNSEYRCNLHPKPDLYPCCSCSRFDMCKSHNKERDYIKSNEESYNSHEENTKIYPCEPFDFGCPDRDNCNEGQNCPWKD